MAPAPMEIVFSLAQATNNTSTGQADSFSYQNGPVKVPGPWKRGRPRIGKLSFGARDARECRLTVVISREEGCRAIIPVYRDLHGKKTDRCCVPVQDS